MRLVSLFMAAVVAASLSGACTAGGSGASSPVPAGLEGRTFLATRVEGPRSLVPGTTIRLSFQRGSVSISAGCNQMGGEYRVDGGRISVALMSMTEMACDEPRMAQDQWVGAMFTKGADIVLRDDTLTLSADGTRVTFLDREVAEPDRPIEGTRWVLEGIVLGSSVSSVPADVTAAIRISAGRVEVEAGCNTGAGTVAVGEDALTFGALGLTKKACPGPAMAVEDAVVAVLAGRVAYAIEADALTLDAGGRGLMFRAAP